MSSELSTTRIGLWPDAVPVRVYASALEIELVASAVWSIALAGRLDGDALSEIHPGELSIELDGQQYVTYKISLLYVDDVERLLVQIIASETYYFWFVIERTPPFEGTRATWGIPEGTNLVRLISDEEDAADAFFRLPDAEKLTMLLGTAG